MNHTPSKLRENRRWVRLGDQVSRVGSGFTPLGGHTVYQESGIPLIRSQNVHMGRFEPDGLAFISSEQDEEMRASRVEAGDILLNITGASIGRVCVAPREFCPANVNQHVCAIRLNGSLDSDFVSFYFASAEFQKFIMQSQAGATRQALTKAMVENFQVPFVKLPEQRRIAGRLREQMATVERARAAVEQQLDAAQKLPAALLRAVFTSRGAQRWPRRKLGELCEIVAKQVDPREPEYRDLPHVSGENIESGLCRLINVRTAAEDNMISGKYLFEAGDVLYSKLRPYLRKVAIAESRGLCSADMYPLRVNPNLMDAKFTAWMLLSEDFSKYAIKESQRSRMPKLNRDQLVAWSEPVPKLEEQRSLVARLESELAAARSLNDSLEKRLAEIELLPAALLRDAFNGPVS
jgi:type I restriction enzyme S subunit